ncbi:ead/Ea22-like family protein [Escherichia coli]|nr:ead/Ea22-like family protein [Escherichia coli]EFN4816918.1 ead/Ea22-like family protein [Escherichia coli]EGH0543384.1 ead/Ea22-like family protein [Escherichia coli]EIP3287479.1 ead/Ea22-like family protein [Escherichia coli]EIR0218527.1 ead/Ea22-like family protein [Escherichia coli]
MREINYQELRERYSPQPVPKCRICGDEMTVQHICGRHITYGCTGATYDDKGCYYAEGRSIADDHYGLSRVTVIDVSDPEVLALLDERERNQQYIKRRDQENEDIALTVGKLRVELEGKDKLIAELGKQCAEWERKALSNFEECAAMAERIEEMSKQSCEARERDLFESWVMHSICISKSTLEGLRTETGYRNATLSGTDFNRMWKQWKSIRAAGIRIKGE